MQSAGYAIRAKIANCRTGEDARMDDDVMEVIEVILENEVKLSPPSGGVEAILKHYEPLTPQHPVGGPIVQINGMDYSWTIE